MPYVKGLWKDGSAGSTYEATAAKMENIENGIFTAGGASINIEEAPFKAKGDGTTDNGAAINAALEAAGPPGTEVPVVIPPGIFATTVPLKVPAGVSVIGMNEPRSRLLAKGNINLFEVQGLNTIANLTMTAETEQASGSAIDCSHGKPSNLWLENLTLGSNFFNGFYLVAESGEFGGVHLDTIRFSDPGGAVKGYKGAGIVIGSSAVRAVAVFIQDIHMQVASTAGMLRGIRINNADSVHLSQVLLQNPKTGLSTGDTDASAKRTTNLFLHDVQSDGCTEGFRFESLLEESNMSACHAEACGTGMIWGESLSGLAVAGSSFYASESHGVSILGSVSPTYGNSIVSSHINSNGTNTEAGMAGINFGEKAGGVILSGNSIGNPALIGSPEASKKQKYGIVFGKKSENIGVYGNRFNGNGTAPFKKEGEEVKINNKPAAEVLAALESVNQMT